MPQTHSTYRRSPQVVAANLGAKSFLLHVTDWVYLELNDSGSVIWSALEDGSTLETITGKLLREFAVTPEVCLQESSEFLEAMQQKHFVLVS